MNVIVMSPEHSTENIKERGKGDHGFIAIAAIAFAGLVMAMAIEFATSVRINTIEASVSLNAVRASAMADGLARLTAWRLARGDQITMNGSTRLCRWRDEATAEIAVQDAAGLIDLNLAPEQLLKDVFVALGQSGAQATSTARSIIDYRDPDQVSANGTAEGTAPRGRRMKNAPLEAVEELEGAADIPESMYRKAKAIFTIQAFQLAIDPETAPTVLRELMAEPRVGPFAGKLLPYAGSSPKRTFSISVRMQLSGGQRFERLATANILRQPDRPFAFLTWNEGAAEGGELPAAAGLAPCFIE